MRTLDDQTFDQSVTSASGPAIVMFSAPWAGPCNLARPAFEDAERRYGNRINFFEFSVEDNPVVPQRFNLRQLPLFVTLEGLTPTSLTAGALSADAIKALCEKLVAD